MAYFYTPLSHRSIIKVYGEDRRSFLQGLITNDVYKLSSENALYAALLTSQGRFLHDLFLCEIDDTLFIEGETERLEDLKRRLLQFKLRSQVSVEIASEEWQVFTLYGDPDFKELNLPAERGAARELFWGCVYRDPRLLTLGLRAMLPRLIGKQELEKAGFIESPFENYNALRLKAGVPDGSHDMLVEKAIILENGLAELQAISWSKGCYIGQELINRTYRQGVIRKRLLPITFEGPAFMPETDLYLNETKVGVIKSSQAQRGLALLRMAEALEALKEKRPLIDEINHREVFVHLPDWLEFPKESMLLPD